MWTPARWTASIRRRTRRRPKRSISSSSIRWSASTAARVSGVPCVGYLCGGRPAGEVGGQLQGQNAGHFGRCVCRFLFSNARPWAARFACPLFKIFKTGRLRWDQRRYNGRRGFVAEGRLIPHHDEAIVLRTWPFHEADLLVSLSTRERGEFKGVARHAMRSRRRFGGAPSPQPR